jgi:hypothetical protein
MGFFKDKKISFEITDNSGVDRSSIQMMVNGQTVTPAITGTSSSYQVVYTPSTPFQSGSTVDVTIQAQDLSDSRNVLNEQYQFMVSQLRIVE